jgi:histidine triad (HIT) family protein
VHSKFEIDKIFLIWTKHTIWIDAFCKKSSYSIEKTVPCKRVGMAVVGLEVPHAHVHLIPLNEMDEMRFQNKVSLTTDEFESLANNIKANLVL